MNVIVAVLRQDVGQHKFEVDVGNGVKHTARGVMHTTRVCGFIGTDTEGDPLKHTYCRVVSGAHNLVPWCCVVPS